MSHPHAQVLGRFSPASLFTKFEFFKWQIDKAFGKDTMDDEVYYVHSTLIHEWIHQIQILGTSFGRQLMFLVMHSGIATGGSYARYIRQGNFDRLRRPLIVNSFFDKMFRDGLTNDDYLGLFSGSLVRKYLGGDSREQFLEGPFPDSFTKRLSPPQDTACPKFGFEGESLNLGGLHLLEGFASINERIFIYLNFSRETFAEALGCIPRYPYYVAESYLEEELGAENVNLWLSRLLCDVSLNGCFESTDPDRRILWEDVHPGWRFVRAVEFLKSRPDVAREVSPENALDVRQRICEEFGWGDPWGDHLSFAHLFDGYIPEALAIRREHPLALMFCVEKFSDLIERFPFSHGYPSAPASLEAFSVSAMEGHWTPDEMFCGYMRLAMIAESVLEVLLSTEIACPIHGVLLGGGEGCVEGCEFVSWFKTVMGMTVEEFSTIPCASKADIDRLDEEEG